MEGLLNLLMTRRESLRGSTTTIADPPGELRSGSRIGIRANEGMGVYRSVHRLTSAVF
jgi:hypothetical protein